MPLNILGTLLVKGTDGIPGWEYIRSFGPLVITTISLKYYFGGVKNTWERDLHGKVYLVTGGTAGLGRSVVEELAKRGAQLILLTSTTPEENPWLVDYIDDLRNDTENILIYTEKCDLSSLYSIRKFATSWLDNTPPRRLDGVICLAGESIPIGFPRQVSIDGVERQIAINYLGHFHLLTLLSPALRVQPPDRDVQILMTTCFTQAMGDIDLNDPLWLNKRYPSKNPWRIFGSSKLMLLMFAKEFQKKIEQQPRKDNLPHNVRINIINPGIMRSPSTRRIISFGAVWGLFLYLILYPIWFIFLKSCTQGAQSYLHVLQNPKFQELKGGNLISDCKIYNTARNEPNDEEMCKQLYDKTNKMIDELEKKSAIERKKLSTKKEKESISSKNNKKDKMPLFPEKKPEKKPDSTATTNTSTTSTKPSSGSTRKRNSKK
ncbi:hypothetical protein PACTADRAFT_48539 [Pachysolen tannophilus NRRL Y-2460]|uniref:Ketoreductase (KR) domain-containing protein n=1 Tax=Pachysolen tannophilus NRRL Y-2460 TaxID=669874 RepID=A0A1E4TYB1_PACTA|nr:hypothetical protein PACTADRAFT_48539 [Pachysolen tannophilus NRRL Y-2460]